MGAPTLTYAQLMELDPCEGSRKRVVKLLGGDRKWGKNGITAAQAKEAGCTLDDLVWAASALAHRDKDVERRLRLWMADCAARVLHIYERTETSEAPRNAIIAARQFARGEIDGAARAAAGDAAMAAARAAGGDPAGIAAWVDAWDAACAAALPAAWDAAGDAEGDPAWAVAMDATGAAAAAAAGDATGDPAWVPAWAVTGDPAWDAARAAEEAWQLDRLVAWMSDVEPADWPLPARQKKDAA